ncbi:DNA-binding Lrp family transcriptional regulator [Breznakia sp. PF5-3]|uniref:Lrp/AsnC family transcriptional regulator n=1 Tax=unclassified Breznakia TaxID=2623764 RepID=UPI0024064294|nr:MULTISPECIES: Lrp/AsnC family transcriptional regulator [unclassified Breznakia]MDF9824556.1 DNA-binding Lrp family transcriptional regulator [Breznakia sp. PM6-1]MDF9835446.1 DNA-binding Lrp family transcriptional regulator [Breznakia sp. PF5-3]MDF9838579.1 DNA-binding Lrp family transcriptional regulator [Breznakia sp. PFB2-8]MDF9860608.1 DNA-binding Lrp family transcriptional regulator [Breznakia sp. PH5-24]
MNDMELLSFLETNARYETKDLAVILQTDEKEVLDKLAAFEKDKIICGYHTIINWDKTHNEKVTSIIYVDAIPQRDSGYDAIARKIYNYPEVESMYLTSGKSDFILTVHGKTMKEIANFIATKLACIDGVTSTSTLFVLQTYKYNGVIMCEEEKPNERLLITP